MKDNIYLRQVLAIVLYLVFFILRFDIDFNIRFFLMVIYVVPIIYYIIYVDEIPIFNKEEIIFFVLSIIYFIFILIIFIHKNENITTTIYPAIIEELFFRFCMLGIIKKYIKFNSPLSLWSILLINSLLFADSHTIQNTIQIIPIIYLGIVFSLIFLSVGIGPSIISHALWNIHHNIFFIYPILIPASFIIILSLLQTKQHKIVSDINKF